MKIGLISTFLLALSLAAPASAATLNSVGAFNGTGGTAGCGSGASQSFSNQPNTVSASFNDGAINCTLSMDATAGGGLVSARGTFNGSGTGQATAGGSSSMTDIYLTPLFDVNDPTLAHNQNFQIAVTLNASIDAIMSSAVDAAGFINRQGGAGASVQGFARLSGFSSFNNSVSDTAQFNDGASSIASFGVDADSATIFQSLAPTLILDWRLPLSVFFNLSGGLSVNGFGLPNQTASFDASNTLSFSKTGPAFILPEGFTVNAPELNIFNNQWIDPRVTPPVSAVPLPAGMPLLLAALAAFGLMRRRI